MGLTDVKHGAKKVTHMRPRNISHILLLFMVLGMFPETRNVAMAEPGSFNAALNTTTRFASISIRQPYISNAEKREDSPDKIQMAPPLTATPKHAPPRALGDNGVRIVTATVDLYEDNDDDGYYQSFVLRFDPESIYRRINVYATIYIRENDNEWNIFYTTDRFTIETNSLWDTTEISARVLGGYPTGDYDLLITLYDAECCGQEIPLLNFFHPVLSGLTLEDADYDDFPQNNATPVYTMTTVAGASHPMLLIGLLLLYASRKSTSRLRRGPNVKIISDDGDHPAHGRVHEKARRPWHRARR